jgi:hypothetical protein
MFALPAGSRTAEYSPAKPTNPSYGADHLYIFLINGVAPMHLGNLKGLGEHLKERGYLHIQYGELTAVSRFQTMIRQIQQDDPSARFVLVGFSLGANKVCELAQATAVDGITIDLLVFLSGNHWLGGLPNEKPSNVTRVVNILASGFLAHTGQRTWAESTQVPGAWHFGTPGHTKTLDLLIRLLAEVGRGR